MAELISASHLDTNPAKDSFEQADKCRIRPHRNEFYDQNEAYRERTYAHGRPPLMTEFMKGLPSGAKVLDIGCGAGRDLAELRSEGFDCEGIDLSPSLARFAAERSGAPVHVGDFQKIDTFESQFDGLLAVASLLHLSRDSFMPTLQSLKDLLRPDGLLFATMKLGSGQFFDTAGRRFTLVEHNEWREYLRLSGFSILEQEITQSDQTVSSSGHIWIATLAMRNG